MSCGLSSLSSVFHNKVTDGPKTFGVLNFRQSSLSPFMLLLAGDLQYRGNRCISHPQFWAVDNPGSPPFSPRWHVNAIAPPSHPSPFIMTPEAISSPPKPFLHDVITLLVFGCELFLMGRAFTGPSVPIWLGCHSADARYFFSQRWTDGRVDQVDSLLKPPKPQEEVVKFFDPPGSPSVS